jgi:hypothetical protein
MSLVSSFRNASLALLALGTLAGVGTVASTTDAEARGFHGGFHRGGIVRVGFVRPAFHVGIVRPVVVRPVYRPYVYRPAVVAVRAPIFVAHRCFFTQRINQYGQYVAVRVCR